MENLPYFSLGVIAGASLLFLAKKLKQVEAFMSDMIMLKKMTSAVIKAVGGTYFMSANNAQVKVTIYVPVQMLDQKTGDIVARQAYLGASEYVKENLPGWVEGAKQE